MTPFATELAPFSIQINGAESVNIENEASFQGACQVIVEAMDSIPKGSREPTKPKDVAVTVSKDGVSASLTIKFLDIAMVRGPKSFAVGAILNDAVRKALSGV